MLTPFVMIAEVANNFSFVAELLVRGVHGKATEEE